MWVATDDVHAHLLAAEAEEEETAGNAVDDDVERVDSCYRTMKHGICYCS